jgi:uncharacterized phage infection (PIP) family protein YhgE
MNKEHNMTTAAKIEQRLQRVFNFDQASVLSEVITEAYNDLVKVSDFRELKEIVREIAKVQKDTDQKMAELAEAQKNTDQKMAELAEAQKKTEEAIKETQKAIKELTTGLSDNRSDLGGLSKSFSYALENEAFRLLPEYLKKKHGIEITEKFIRTDMGNKEINIFAKARKDGKEIVIVGEAKARLDDKRIKKVDVFNELEEKVKVVKEETGADIVPLLITHFATKSFLKKASDKNIIVVQSYEWV